MCGNTPYSLDKTSSNDIKVSHFGNQRESLHLYLDVVGYKSLNCNNCMGIFIVLSELRRK